MLQAAAETMGVDDMMSIRYSGDGWVGARGPELRPPPRTGRVSSWRSTRAPSTSRPNRRPRRWSIRQGNYPARGGGGAPIVGDRVRNWMVRGEYAWNGEIDRVVPRPQDAERRRLEIYLTPQGFLKGAMAADDVIAVERNEYGGRVTVVSFVALDKYRIQTAPSPGTTSSSGVQTWMPSPVVGDMYYETVYTNYQDVGGGMMFPMNWHQHQDFDDGAHAPNVSGGDHTFQLSTIDSVEVNVADAALDVPDAARNATVPPLRVAAEEVAEGVWLMAGGSHHSVAVEFEDEVAVIEAPLNEARSLAVMDEIRRRIPGKEIRWGRDHPSPLGPPGRHARLRPRGRDGRHAPGGTSPTTRRSCGRGRGCSSRTASRCSRRRSGRKATSSRRCGRSYILGDTTRLVEIHHVQGLAHAAGMLMAYLPNEKILVEADLFTAARTRRLAARESERQRPDTVSERCSGWASTSRPSSPFTGFRGRWSQFAEWVEAAQ